MEATLEEFGTLYSKYASSLFEEACEVIVSYEPTGNQLMMVNKLSSLDASFSKYLVTKGHKEIKAERANKFYAPMAMPDITIHYVAVPDRKTEYQMDLGDLVRL